MDGWITIGTKLDTKEFDNQIQDLERKANELEDVLAKRKEIGLSSREVQEVEVELEKVRNKLVQLNQQKAKINTPSTTAITGINDLGKSLESTIKKASRLVLGIFGIRSAYMALRSASSNLASYDEQYATNLEYIRYVLTQAIAPVLRYIVNLAMTLLSYINAIAQAWFGVNLFANGSAESFKKMKTQAGGVTKAVKEIKKQLMGFDEVNVLTADSDTGTGVGAGGVGVPMPSMDLSKLDIPIPKWLDWIAKHKKEILAFLAGLVAGITAFKNGVKGIKSLGIGMMVGGIVYAIQGLLGYLQDPTWLNFGKVIQGIGVFVAGLGVAFLGLPAILTGVAVLILGTVTKYWDIIREKLQGAVDWLREHTDWIREHFGIVGEAIYTTILNLVQNGIDFFNIFFTDLKNIFDGIIQFVKGAFTGSWEEAFEGLKKIVFNVFDIIANRIMVVFTTIGTIISGKIDFIKNLFSGAISTIVGWFGEMGTNVANAIADTFKNIINRILEAVEYVINRPIDAINALITTIRNVPRIRRLKQYREY